MAYNWIAGSGLNNQTFSTITFPDTINAGDLVVIQITQKGGSVGTFNDPLNSYTLYSSNEGGDAPQSYNFYSIASSTTLSGTTITYTPSGVTTNIGLGYTVFRPDAGEKFGPPVVTTSTTGNTPVRTISTTLTSVTAPAVMIASTNLTSMSGFNYPADNSGEVPWIAVYFNPNIGMASAYKITRSDATHVYNPTFNLTTGFQTLLNFPLVLSLSSARTISGGRFPDVKILTAIFAGANSGASIKLNPVSQGMTSKAFVLSDADSIVSVESRPIISLSTIANLQSNLSVIYQIGTIASSTVYGGIRLSTPPTALQFGGAQAIASSNGFISLNPVVMSIPSTRAFATSSLNLISQMITTSDGLAVSSTIFAKTILAEKINFQTNIIQSVNTQVFAQERLSTKYILPLQILSISNLGIATSSVARISPIQAIADSNGYIDPLLLSIGNTNLTLSLSGLTTLNEKFSLVIAMPSGEYLGNFAGAISSGSGKLGLPQTIKGIINTTSNANVNLIYSQPFRLIINATSDADMQSSAIFNISSNAGVISNSIIKFASSDVLNISASLIADSNMVERFNFQTRIINSVNAMSNLNIVAGVRLNLPLTLGSISGALSLVGQTSDIAPLPPLYATAKIDGRSIITIQIPLSIQAIGDSNLSEKFNFQTIILNAINASTNLNISTQSKVNISSVAIANASGYIDPLLYPTNFIQLQISSATAKVTVAEKFNFQSILIESFNTKANLFEKFNFQIRILSSTNSSTYATEKFAFIQASRSAALINSSGYIDPLLAPVNVIQLSPVQITAIAKSNAIEKINLINAIIVNLNDLSINLIAESILSEKFNFQSRIVQSINAQANTNSNIVYRMPLSIQAFADSSGYIDPLLSSISTSSTRSQAIGISGLTINPSVIFAPSSNLIADSNLVEKFNFQSRIIQSVNSQISANALIAQGFNIPAQAQAITTGYADPTISVSVNFVPIQTNAIIKSNANIAIKIIADLSATNLIADSNLVEKFNFQSRIIQSVNTTSNSNSVIFIGQPLKLSLNAQSNGYVESIIQSIQIINISAQAGVKSGGFEKLTLTGSFVSELPTIALNVDLIQDGTFELGGSLWQGINNTISVVNSDQGKSLKINNSFQDYELQPSGPLGVYQTFKALAGYKYLLSAQVQNVNGTSPRDMYVQITWSNGVIDKSSLVPVSVSNGWVTLGLEGDAQSNGIATVYIVTSSPFDNFNATDLALVDNVSLYITATPANPYISLVAKTNAVSAVQLTTKISEKIIASSNLNVNVGVIARISPLGLQAITTGYTDLAIPALAIFNVGPISLIAKVNAKEYFNFTSLPILSINTNSNLVEKIRHLNVINAAVFSSANANSLINTTHRLQSNIAIADSSGYIDPLFNSINNINVSSQAIAKVIATEKISLVQTFSTATQIVPNLNNQIQDGSYELGSSYWFGINNYITVSTESAYDGSYSLKTNTLNAYEEYLEGPLGAGQNFAAIGGRTYNLSAYVQNTSGKTPRDMYVAIQWNGSTAISGISAPVAQGSGWVKVELTGVAPTSGIATAYIITSSPFNSLGGDTSLIDNVSLSILDTLGPAPYIGINATSNAVSRVLMPLTISSIASTTTNLGIIPSVKYIVQPNIVFADSIANSQITTNIPLTISLNAKSFGSYPRASVLQISTAQGLSNATEKISFNSKIVAGITTTSTGYAPDILSANTFNLGRLTLVAIAGGQERVTLLQTLIANQPVSSPGEMLLDTNFDLGSFYWNGLSNQRIEISSDSHSGGNSILVRTTDISDPDYLMPMGVTQKFDSIAGREFLATAYVKNLVGDSRGMFIKIAWENGYVSEGKIKKVAQADGWTRLELRTNAPNTGPASLYVITSNAFVPFLTDVALIDDISLTMPNVAPLTINMIANSVANERISVKSILNLASISESNLKDSLRTNYVLPMSVNATSSLNIVSVIPITLGLLSATAKVYTAEAFSLISTLKVPDNLDSVVISLIADSNAFIRIRFISSIDSSNALANSNLLEKFNFQSRLREQITTTSLGFADPAIASVGSITKLSAGMKSSGDVVVTIPIDIQAINAIADTNARDKFNFESVIIQSINSESNLIEFVRHNSRLVPVANITSNALVLTSSSQPSNIKPIFANVISGGDAQVFVSRELGPLNALANTNSLSRIGISYSLRQNERINLLKNASFEEGTAYWNSISNYNTISKDIFYEGTQSLFITDNDWGNSGVWQEFGAIAGANYIFSAYVRNITGLSPRNMQLQIQWADGTISNSDLVSINNSDGWVRLLLVTNAGKEKSGKATATIITSSLPDAFVESNAVSAVDAVVLVPENVVTEFFIGDYPTGTILQSKSGASDKIAINNRLVLSANIQSNSAITTNPPALIRIGSQIAGATSSGYIDSTIVPITTFAPITSAIAKVNGSIGIRVISDLSGTTSIANVNAISKPSHNSIITPLRAQVQSVGQGNFNTFNPGLIIPQFSKGFAKVGGDVLVSVTFNPSSNLIALTNQNINVSVEYILSEVLLVKSNAGGKPNFSADPGIITQLVPYEIRLVGTSYTRGSALANSAGNLGDFIGWGQPI